MKTKEDKKLLVVLVYISVVVIFYLVMLYPVLKKSKVITKSKVPSLSISGINEINQTFAKIGKSWNQNAVKPNINSYVYGQRDPM